MPSQPLLCSSTSFPCVGTEDEKLDEPSVLILKPVWAGLGSGEEGGHHRSAAGWAHISLDFMGTSDLMRSPTTDCAVPQPQMQYPV